MNEEKHIYPIFDKMLSRNDKEELLKQHGVMVWFTGLSGKYPSYCRDIQVVRRYGYCNHSGFYQSQ